MMLNELVNLVAEKRKEINKEKIEKELRDILNQLSAMRESIEKLKEIKLKMILCDGEIKEIRDDILSTSDPSTLSKLVSVLYTKTLDCYNRKEEERRKKLEEERKKIEELNKRLMLYKKIFKNVLGENIDIYLLNGHAEDLEGEIQKGEEQLKGLYENLKVKVGDKLDLLIQLIYSNEIEVNKDNYSEVIELIKFLIDKGIIVSIRLSK